MATSRPYWRNVNEMASTLFKQAELLSLLQSSDSATPVPPHLRVVASGTPGEGHVAWTAFKVATLLSVLCGVRPQTLSWLRHEHEEFLTFGFTQICETLRQTTAATQERTSTSLLTGRAAATILELIAQVKAAPAGIRPPL